MININVGPNILVGMLIIAAFLGLYFVRTVKFELSRDVDMFYTSLGLMYSSILIIHGWRLDPILLFSQILILMTILGIGWENIRLRGLLIADKMKYKTSGNKDYLGL
jgi:hypothetical protein